jgi:hypothetical protein
VIDEAPITASLQWLLGGPDDSTLIVTLNQLELNSKEERGAHARIRTGDLLLTKEMLYRLSYVGAASQGY